MLHFQDLRDLLGHDVPNKVIEDVIAEADLDDDNRVTYEDFLQMWRQELEDRQMRAWREISRQRTVSVLADEMLASSTDDEDGSKDSDDNDDFLERHTTNRLVSIAEMEQEKKESVRDLR